MKWKWFIFAVKCLMVNESVCEKMGLGVCVMSCRVVVWECRCVSASVSVCKCRCVCVCKCV